MRSALPKAGVGASSLNGVSTQALEPIAALKRQGDLPRQYVRPKIRGEVERQVFRDEGGQIGVRRRIVRDRCWHPGLSRTAAGSRTHEQRQRDE